MKLIAKSDDLTLEVELDSDDLDCEDMQNLFECFGELVKVIAEALIIL